MGKAEVLWSLWARLSSQGVGGTFAGSGLIWCQANAVSQALLTHGAVQLLCFALRAVALAPFIGKALLGHCVLWRMSKCQRLFLLLAFETKLAQL